MLEKQMTRLSSSLIGLFIITILSIIIFSLAMLPMLAHADAPPPLISYQGHLLDNSGTPLTGTTSLTFALYSTALDSTPFWEESQAVALDSGLFSVLLGSVTPLDPLDFATGNAWLGIQPAGSAELAPRQQISSVPYALYAGSANYSVGYGLALENNTFRVLSDTIQSRISGTCPNGYAFKAVNTDGTVSCNPMGVMYVHKGTGIVGDGSTTTGGTANIYVDTAVIQHRVSGTCTTGSSIRSINADGSVVCDPPPAVQACKIISDYIGDGTFPPRWVTATLSTDDFLPLAFDTMNCWDSNTHPNYITVPLDGYYQVGGEAHYVRPHTSGGSGSGVVGIGFRAILEDSGDTYTLVEDHARVYENNVTNEPDSGAASGSTTSYLYAGDKLYLHVYRNQYEDLRGSLELRYLGQ